MEGDYDPNEQGIVKVRTDIEMHDEMDDEEDEGINFDDLSPDQIQQLLAEHPELAEEMIRQGRIVIADDEEELEGEDGDYDDEEDEEEYFDGEEDMFERMREEERDMREGEVSEVN